MSAGRGKGATRAARATAIAISTAILNEGTTVIEPTVEQLPKTEDALDVPWQVIVHNDPINLMSYVTMVFQRVFGFPREKAEHHMREVHELGRSVLWSGVRERAELYVQQLHGYLLLATIEKAG